MELLAWPPSRMGAGRVIRRLQVLRCRWPAAQAHREMPDCFGSQFRSGLQPARSGGRRDEGDRNTLVGLVTDSTRRPALGVDLGAARFAADEGDVSALSEVSSGYRTRRVFRFRRHLDCRAVELPRARECGLLRAACRATQAPTLPGSRASRGAVTSAAFSDPSARRTETLLLACQQPGPPSVRAGALSCNFRQTPPRHLLQRRLQRNPPR